MHRGVLPVLAALLFAPCAVWPQGNPLGPEFRVNTYTTGNQGRPLFSSEHPSVTSDSSGNFVAVWTSAQDSSYGIFGQRYDASGTPLGPEFRVNTYTTNRQYGPSVASDPAGNFVVVWHSNFQDGSNLGVFGQRYASSGVPLGSEFRVNTYTTGTQGSPSVAADSSGNFVVVWGRRYTSPCCLTHVFGRRYSASGAPLAPEFRVNTSMTGYQASPAAASDASGNFVVVWSTLVGLGGTPADVSGQRYASTGAPLGSEFRVNTTTSPGALRPSVATDSAGDFVVVWESVHDGSSSGVFAQRYANTGAPLGPEFRVNTYTTDTQYLPGVASDAAGKFVVVWCSIGQDGSDRGVFGQRYSMIVPVELTRYTVE